MTNDQKPRVVDPHNLPKRPVRPPPRPRDIRQTKEYKSAARRWTATIVALPIAMYTSYILYDRTYGSKRTLRKREIGNGNGNENEKDQDG